MSTNGGLSVINTQGTIDPADDTLVKTYTTATTPAIADNYVRYSFLDSATHLLYVVSNDGLSVINTQGTIDPADDTLVKTYTTATSPAIGNNIKHSFLDSANHLLYSSTFGRGLSVINLNNQYNREGIYTGSPQSIVSTPTTTLAFDATQSAGQSTSLAYRTGDSNAAWADNFDDNNTSEYLGDFYGWGGAFQTAVESGGTMKLSNPKLEWSDPAGDGTDSIIDTGKPAGYFPLGSKVTIRYKMNTSATGTGGCIYNDEWWDDDGCPTIIPNQWTITSFTAGYKAFSKIGFEMWWNTGTWNNATDNFEIDWIRIEKPDSAWNSWSAPCTSPTSCPITPSDLTNKEWIQYQLYLTTNDTNTTPTVNSVTFGNGYEHTGTTTSATRTFDAPQNFTSFSSDISTSTDTNITFEYSTDNGTTWTGMGANQTFNNVTGTSFTWRATLSTTNGAVTPAIHSVTLLTTPVPPAPVVSSGGSVPVAFISQPSRPTVAPTVPTLTAPAIIPPAPSLAPPPVTLFSSSLRFGTKGDDVITLQKMLNTLGYLVSKTGEGSKGKETDYYGKKTQIAVQKFQCKEMNICSGNYSTTGYGRFGNATKGKLGEVWGKIAR